jgi:hypothetical protein
MPYGAHSFWLSRIKQTPGARPSWPLWFLLECSPEIVCEAQFAVSNGTLEDRLKPTTVEKMKQHLGRKMAAPKRGWMLYNL